MTEFVPRPELTDEEVFFAWLDGELPPAQAAALAARVATEPALAELARRHRGLVEQMRGSFDGLDRSDDEDQRRA